MTNILNETEEEIKAIIENCRTANEGYFTYFKKYYSELVNADAKLTRKDERIDLLIQGGLKYIRGKDTLKERKQLSKLVEPEDLPLVIIAKRIFNKNFSKEAKQLKELEKPKPQLIPKELDTINGMIKRILTKRGWD